MHIYNWNQARQEVYGAVLMITGSYVFEVSQVQTAPILCELPTCHLASIKVVYYFEHKPQWQRHSATAAYVQNNAVL
jgi:hypothetical protein